jgi:predicted nucleic acid-binding protein
MDPCPGELVLDTNVSVAAGFNPGSHSARLLEAIRDGRLRMIWDDATREETELVMRSQSRVGHQRVTPTDHGRLKSLKALWFHSDIVQVSAEPLSNVGADIQHKQPALMIDVIYAACSSDTEPKYLLSLGGQRIDPWRECLNLTQSPTLIFD